VKKTMSKITRISAALALMVAVVSGCKSNNSYPDGSSCGCGGAPVTTGVGAPVTTHSAPAGMTTPISSGTMGGSMGSAMPTGSSSFAPTSQGMGGSQFSR
jgi:hypothetical protein